MSNVSGICAISLIPVRKEPSHRSEMVSQLLFGEGYDIVETKDSWLRIQIWHDDYEGWMDLSQHQPLSAKETSVLKDSKKSGIALEVVNSAAGPNRSIALVSGSTLPEFDGLNFRMAGEKFIYNGQSFQAEQLLTLQPQATLERLALRYIHAPYLWGGRSPFGIDCSGLVQILFKCIGKKLPRDAYQQAELGTTLNFVEETQPGDLAFFNNNEGRITHVGLILKENQIIHASGKVRVDPLDHFGIFNPESKKYSHQLKILRRIL